MSSSLLIASLYVMCLCPKSVPYIACHKAKPTNRVTSLYKYYCKHYSRYCTTVQGGYLHIYYQVYKTDPKL